MGLTRERESARRRSGHGAQRRRRDAALVAVDQPGTGGETSPEWSVVAERFYRGPGMCPSSSGRVRVESGKVFSASATRSSQAVEPGAGLMRGPCRGETCPAWPGAQPWDLPGTGEAIPYPYRVQGHPTQAQAGGVRRTHRAKPPEGHGGAAARDTATPIQGLNAKPGGWNGKAGARRVAPRFRPVLRKNDRGPVGDPGHRGCATGRAW